MTANGCLCSPDCACGACRGFRDSTPVLVDNRPGLASIQYRVGDHARFKASLITALSRAGHPALRDLTARSDDDFSIALLDAWAVVADILTFYQERIANESYLRTASERLSVGHVAKLIGYELRPGSAANVSLAFRMMEAPGLPKGSPGVVQKLTLPVGTRVQSTPGPDETPQTFETIEEMELRPAWNAIAAATLQEQELSAEVEELRLKGSSLNLRGGDVLLLVLQQEGETESSAVYRRIKRVELDARADETRVLLQAGTTYPGATFAGLSAEQTGVFAFRRQASLFGHNAPNYGILKLSLPTLPGEDEWEPTDVGNSETTLFLDSVHRDVVPGSWSIWERADPASAAPASEIAVLRILSAVETGLAAFSLGGKATSITFDQGLAADSPSLVPPSFAALRSTTLLLQSEKLTLVQVPKGHPVPAPVMGSTIDLAEPAEDLQPGRRVAVSGKRLRAEALQPVSLAVAATDGPVTKMLVAGDRLDLTAFPQEQDSGQTAYVGSWEGQPATVTARPRDVVRADEDASELGEIASVSTDGRRITLAEPLAWCYDPATVRVNANVVAATHGESVKEVFDGGDARVPFQSLPLKQPPITYVSAATPSGTVSTLRVFVDDVEWHEVPFLYGRGPSEQVFITRGDGDGRAWIQFGDGLTGARLPTGARNVRAEYRRGLGAPGNLDAGQINLLLSRPLGLQEASNPLPSSDGKDSEAVDDARANAPLTVLTLDRVVSLQDYEDFARAFAGVAKAAATWTWFGQSRGVFITVAGADGGVVSLEGRQTLKDSLAEWGDPYIPVAVENHVAATFFVGVRVKVDPDRQADIVLANVEAALRETFSFERRALGQDAGCSEVAAAAQAVAGVVAVQVTSLHRSDDSDAGAGLVAPLPAGAPLPGERGSVQAAELLTLDPAPFELLEEME